MEVAAAKVLVIVLMEVVMRFCISVAYGGEGGDYDEGDGGCTVGVGGYASCGLWFNGSDTGYGGDGGDDIAGYSGSGSGEACISGSGFHSSCGGGGGDRSIDGGSDSDGRGRGSNEVEIVAKSIVGGVEKLTIQAHCFF
ncbi:loricrin-like [Papaver somniferum]|uniref:loricrin-like n=1 Tax=Papaver somniferum TaxID=3469 RepID=UPI000E702C91|nr:loricrin-like [Papaver somniferum]